MPCTSMRKKGQSLEQRISEVDVALKRLEVSLGNGRVQVVVGPNGAVALKGWEAAERSDVSDVCAVRSLMATGSWALRQAVARAEALSGRKVNVRAVAAGVHSHDGGRSWNKGH